MTTAEASSEAPKNSGDGCEQSQEGTRKWTFNVEVEDILPYEVVVLTGCCDTLGNWTPKDGVIMNYESDNKKWKITTEIPFGEKLFYRYFIGVVNRTEIYIRQWEAHLKPRIIHKNDVSSETQDKFGLIENVKIVQRGWLTTETVLQFKLMNKSLIINDELLLKKISIKVTPKRFEYSTGLPQYESSSPLMFDPGQTEVVTEVVKFVYGESVLRPQSEYGMVFNSDDIVIFHITVSNLKHFAFLFEIFYRTEGFDEMQFLGSQYIMPYDLRPSEGRLELPIINSINCPSGALIINYLSVTPLRCSIPDLRTSYVKQWRKDCSTQLNVGHRGCGVSFRSRQSDEIENTLASFKRAGQHGADMIECDVHLTRDLIPIIFHDFEINIALNAGTPSKNIKDFLEVPVKDLTLTQLHSAQMYYIQSGQAWKYPRKAGDQQICPTLEQLFDTIDPNLAFDIEIKWPQELLIDGQWEGRLQTIDKNEYVNRILDVILRKGSGRCLMLTSFDADICTMLRLKQNIYPVVFLALGLSERYPKYKDVRCNIYEMAMCNAQAMELVGVGPHSEDFVKDPSLVKLIKNLDMFCFCWGDDSRDKATFQRLRDMGIDGIVCDGVDRLSAETDTGRVREETNVD